MKGCQKVAKSKYYVNKIMKKPRFLGAFSLKVGSVLLSQGVAPQVPSALMGLTSVFGMGTGVSPLLSPPQIYFLKIL